MRIRVAGQKKNFLKNHGRMMIARMSSPRPITGTGVDTSIQGFNGMAVCGENVDGFRRRGIRKRDCSPPGASASRKFAGAFVRTWAIFLGKGLPAL